MHRRGDAGTGRCRGWPRSHGWLWGVRGSGGGGSSVLDGHGTLAVRQVHQDEAVGVGLGGHAGLAAEQVEGGPGGDGLLEATQAAAAVGQHEVVEGVGLEVCDELLGGPAVYVQCEPIVLDLRARSGSARLCAQPPPRLGPDPAKPTQTEPLPQLSEL